MTEHEQQCRALYMQAFAGEEPAFCDALFSAYYPRHVVTATEEGRVASMLFSIPYPIVLGETVCEARYLYGIATHPDLRGRGHARRLIAAEAAAHPVFLRPMTPSLFRFYEKAGLSPFSPLAFLRGDAADGALSVRHLTPAQYLEARDARLRPPFARMSERFLSLVCSYGGLIEAEGALALYDTVGDTVTFKEWWGDPEIAPRLAAKLGAAHYELRSPAPDGAPFGMMAGLPPETVFLAAMD